jgi:hypothetical protein
MILTANRSDAVYENAKRLPDMESAAHEPLHSGCAAVMGNESVVFVNNTASLLYLPDLMHPALLELVEGNFFLICLRACKNFEVLVIVAYIRRSLNAADQKAHVRQGVFMV